MASRRGLRVAARGRGSWRALFIHKVFIQCRQFSLRTKPRDVAKPVVYGTNPQLGTVAYCSSSQQSSTATRHTTGTNTLMTSATLITEFVAAKRTSERALLFITGCSVGERLRALETSVTRQPQRNALLRRFLLCRSMLPSYMYNTLIQRNNCRETHS